MRTIQQALHYAVPKLKDSGIDTPSLDAEVMLSYVLKCSRTDLHTHPEKEIPENQWRIYIKLIERRANREPLAYITGEKEFFGICFKVGPEVLIPRPETELLVEIAVDLMNVIETPKIADIGLGSGAIAVSIAKAIPKAHVYGTDISSSALQIASENAKKAEVGKQVDFRQGDLFDVLKGLEFDLIVSNPPYIPTAEISKLQPEVAKFEPKEALDGGQDGLDCIRRIVRESLSYVKGDGYLAVEIGIGQSPAVIDFFGDNGFIGVQAKRDYAGIDRVIIGKRANK